MRTIWTPDGEIDVPTKSRRYLQQSPRMLRAKVSNIWAKDEKGQVILRDPLGIENTITNGAAWAILNSLFGFSGLWDNTNSVDVMTSQSVTGNAASASSVYDDGTFSFPATTSIANAYASGGDTYIIGYDAARIFSIFFGTLWFIDGSSGGLSGSHIPATITCGTGFNSGVVGLTSDAGPNSGWFSASGLPTTSLGTTNTTLSDSLSSSASGTPSISHSFTLSSSSSALSFTFDGIAWLPVPGWNGAGQSVSTYGSSSAYSSTGWWAGGVVGSTTVPTWASASSTPTTISNLQVSALWNPGYAITLNPGGSWGFTYTFEA